MVIGLKKWNIKDTYFIQTNNPTEEILRKEDGKGFLETCGPTAAVNCLAARGNNIEIICPGSYEPQPEEVLNDYFHDPRNYPKLKEVRSSIDPSKFFNNRVPQDYQVAIPDVFGVKASFEWKNIQGIDELLKNNIAIMLCLKDPGHYIAVVAYETESKEVCYRDSWPNNYWPKNLKGTSGFNRWIPIETLQKNLSSYRVLIG